MPTAVENSYVVAKLDELEPAARLAPERRTTEGSASTSAEASASPPSAFRRSARRAGSSSSTSIDETLLGEAGQEELYIVMNGAATFEIDGEAVDAAGALVQVQPTAKRKATATEDGTTILVVGGTAGKA